MLSLAGLLASALSWQSILSYTAPFPPRPSPSVLPLHTGLRPSARPPRPAHASASSQLSHTPIQTCCFGCNRKW